MSRLQRLITEIHRRSLWQVLGIYAVASWAIYQVVLGLYEGIGLPGFVPKTTLALLLVFLPVVLATAFVQEGGPRRGRADDTVTEGPEDPPRPADAETPKPKTGLFTWNRAITLGVLAFALLGLATTGVMGMRLLGIGPAATLISSGVLEEREPVLLADLEAPSGDSLLAAALTEALRVDLEQSPAVRLVPGPSVQEALRRMRRDPSSRLTPALAREVALREGVRALVVGEVLPAGKRYVVAARVATPDGEVLASDRQSAGDDGLIEAVDRLSSKLRNRIGESLQSLHSTQPLARVTTGSLDALRKYTQGVRAFETDADTRKAIRLLREAVALDSAFTMAWRKLGAAYQNRGGPAGRDSMRVALTHAFRHRDRSTDRERYLTEGSYYQFVANDPEKAIVALEMVLDLGSEDAIALHNLALLYSASGNWDRAAELQARSLAFRSRSGVAWRNYASYLVRLRRFDDAAAALDDYERAHPDHYQIPLYSGYLAAVRFDYATAEAEFKKVRGFTGHEHGADAALWAVATVQGRYRDASAVSGEEGESPAARRVVEAFFRLAHLQDPDGARRLLRDVSTEDLTALRPPGSVWALAVGAAAGVGSIEQADAFLKAWETDDPGAFDPPVVSLVWARSELALARDDPETNIRRLRPLVAEGDCAYCTVHLARAFEAAGIPDSAMAAYERYIDLPHPGLTRIIEDQIHLPWTLQRLAVLHEDAGHLARAAHYYAWLVDLWKNADPMLQPRVDAARDALERISAEGT
ncbi:MAG: hypothetical protein P8099_16070 [Gemmatimonadota bacterium]